MSSSRTHIITGTTSGIGLALVKKLLVEGDKVVSISRRPLNLEQPNLNHVYLDLNSRDEVAAFDFPIIETQTAFLVNNAGMIGNIKPFWAQASTDLTEVMEVNVNSLMVLCQKFVAQLVARGISGGIVNISSGAASSAIPSWSAYCASKAAVEMFSKVMNAEMTERGIPCKVWSVAPGVVDTGMQEDIREASEEDFSRSGYFRELKESGQLVDPETTAEYLTKLISGELPTEDCVLTLRDFYPAS